MTGCSGMAATISSPPQFGQQLGIHVVGTLADRHEQLHARPTLPVGLRTGH